MYRKTVSSSNARISPSSQQTLCGLKHLSLAGHEKSRLSFAIEPVYNTFLVIVYKELHMFPRRRKKREKERLRKYLQKLTLVVLSTQNLSRNDTLLLQWKPIQQGWNKIRLILLFIRPLLNQISREIKKNLSLAQKSIM